jgi:hypothetical protein
MYMFANCFQKFRIVILEHSDDLLFQAFKEVIMALDLYSLLWEGLVVTFGAHLHLLGYFFGKIF